MNDDITDRITTADAFESALGDIVAAARRNEIRVAGGWSPSAGDGTHWDVVITRVVSGDE
jgi:hypothetical protein